MEFEVVLYEYKDKNCPVINFIKSLNSKEIAKIERGINLLKDYGINLHYPHTKNIEGDRYKGLWELRIKLATNNFRIFYFMHKDNKFILLHGIRKKSDKTPIRDLEISINRMNDYIIRSDNDEVE